MQIIKQCEELRSLGEHAEGYLCGLLEADLSSGNRLEVTYAYPSLRGETTDQEADGMLFLRFHLLIVHNDHCHGFRLKAWYETELSWIMIHDRLIKYFGNVFETYTRFH